MRKLMVFIAFVLVITLLCSGCDAGNEKTTLYIAEQFGTAYAPVAYMRETGILQEMLPDGTEIRWSQLGNTAAIREAMLAGEADVGFMAIPPFIIGLDAGMDWKICSGISDVPMGLVSANPDITKLSEIGNARIALPQPGSIQHILLAMAAERELGSYDVFDNQLVTMSHPDGMSAMLSGTEISLHFTTEPYLGKELNSGMFPVLSGAEAMGEDFTGIVAVARDAFRNENEEIYDIFLSALHESIDRINSDPAAAAKVLATVYDMAPDDLLAEFTADGAAYRSEVQGAESFSAFLRKAGYTKRDYSIDELVAPGVSVK